MMKWNDELKPLLPGHKTYKVIAFDVETQGHDKDFCMCGIRDETGYHDFYDQEAACQYLLNNHHRGIRFATNLGFDYVELFWNTKHRYELKPLPMNGSIIRVNYLKDPHIFFLDTMRFLPLGVGKLGKIIGLEKLDDPPNVEHYELKMNTGQVLKLENWKEPKDEFEWKAIRDYNERDCEITYRAVVDVIQRAVNDIDATLKTSIASTSLNGWRKTLPYKLVKESVRYPGVDDPIRSSFYGGRSEVFARGAVTDVSVYDCNSMYPSVMLNEYPDPNSIQKIVKPDKTVFEDYGFSLCRITAPHMRAEVLPYRLGVTASSKGKLVFPQGSWTGWYNHSEISESLKEGYSVKPLTSYIYPKTWYPFKDYITKLYDKRLELIRDKNPLEKMYKALMTNLFGKFSEHDHQEISIEEAKPGVKYDADVINGIVLWKKLKKCESVHVFPILSNQTAAYARLKLFPIIKKYDAYYMDTDSCFTKEEMPTSDKLGAFKFEYKIKRGVIVRPKHYDPGNGAVKIKGVHGADDDIFQRVLLGQRVYMTHFSKFKESIRKGIKPNTESIKDKGLSLEDDKRQWYKKFNPYEFDDESDPLKISL